MRIWFSIRLPLVRKLQPIDVSGAISSLRYFMILIIFTIFCLYQFLFASGIGELVAPIGKKNGVMEYCHTAIKLFLIV